MFRLQQNQQRKKKFSRKRVPNDNTYTATDNDTDIDAFSTAGTDVGNDEFFDCSDSENGISDIETRLVYFFIISLIYFILYLNKSCLNVILLKTLSCRLNLQLVIQL